MPANRLRLTLPVAEAPFQQSIIELARLLRWKIGFTYDSRHSEPGEPDLRMVRPPRYLVVEVKTDKGKLSKGKWNKKKTRWLPGQDEWREDLMACPGIEYYQWRPRDWDEIVRVLGLIGPGNPQTIIEVEAI